MAFLFNAEALSRSVTGEDRVVRQLGGSPIVAAAITTTSRCVAAGQKAKGAISSRIWRGSRFNSAERL